MEAAQGAAVAVPEREEEEVGEREDERKQEVKKDTSQHDKASARGQLVLELLGGTCSGRDARVSDRRHCIQDRLAYRTYRHGRGKRSGPSNGRNGAARGLNGKP